jgi:hypothetical protein
MRLGRISFTKSAQVSMISEQMKAKAKEASRNANAVSAKKQTNRIEEISCSH